MKLASSLFVLLAACSACAAKCPQGSGAAAAGEPGAQPGQVEVAPNATSAAMVTLDADGRAWIDGQPVASDDELATRLGSRTGQSSVTLAADARVPHGRVMAVIDRLRAAGVTRVAYAASTPTPTGAPPEEAAGDAQPPPESQPVAPEPPIATTVPAASGEAPGSLPAVTVETVGLHIGGGPNDDATKAPFLRALSERFDTFRACYVKAEEPEKGGTFGVDLFIARGGGAPQVRQPRTGMKGAEFRKCVVEAFQQVAFDKPAKGPTVISYSIRYRLK